MYSTWVDVSFTKWNALSLTDYDKVMFVDADKIALSNIDELFTLPAPAGTFSSPWSYPFAKEGSPFAHSPPYSSRFVSLTAQAMWNPYLSLCHGDQVPAKAIEDVRRACL